MSCKDVFTDEERKHLEEVLHGDLDGYWEEIKDTFVEPSKSSPNPEEREDNRSVEQDFYNWKKLSNDIFKKCKLNKWEIP